MERSKSGFMIFVVLLALIISSVSNAQEVIAPREYPQGVSGQSPAIPETSNISGKTPGADEFMQSQQKRFRQAIAYKEGGNYSVALEVLTKLMAETPGNADFETNYIDTILEKSLDMKRSGVSGWKETCDSVKDRLKLMKKWASIHAGFNYAWAKYSWIIEANNTNNIYKPLARSLQLNPLFADAHILKGDIYADNAQNFKDKNTPETDTGFIHPQATRSDYIKTAKDSYNAALKISSLSRERRAYVYYMIGLVEYNMNSNKSAASENWNHAVSAAPDSRAGLAAQQRLGKIRM